MGNTIESRGVWGRWRGDQEWDRDGRFGSSTRTTESILKGFKPAYGVSEWNRVRIGVVE